MISTPETGQPVFILGNPRSGTTFFRLVLTAHSKIGIPPETDFIVRHFLRYGHIHSFSEDQWNSFAAELFNGPIDLRERWKVTATDLLLNKNDFVGKSFSAICSQIYQNYQSARGFAAKEVWGDKNNAYGNYIDVLNYIFPSARYIHLVRDGRAVLNSYRKLEAQPRQLRAPMLPKDAKEVAFRWVDMTGRIDRHLRKYAPDRHLCLRYEDIIGDFENEIARVTHFLGIQYEEEMRDFYKMNRKHEFEPREYAWKENTFKPLDPEKKDAWLTELTECDIEAFERGAAKTLIRYNYDLKTTASWRAQSSVSKKRMFSALFREKMRAARLAALKLRAF